MEENTENKLIFKGPRDFHPDTLRNLKSALLSDFGLSMREIEAIIKQAPVTIKRAQDPKDLEVYCLALQKAGAEVVIVCADIESINNNDTSTQARSNLDLQTEVSSLTAPAQSTELLIEPVANQATISDFDLSKTSAPPKNQTAALELILEEETPAIAIKENKKESIPIDPQPAKPQVQSLELSLEEEEVIPLVIKHSEQSSQHNLQTPVEPQKIVTENFSLALDDQPIQKNQGSDEKGVELSAEIPVSSKIETTQEVPAATPEIEISNQKTEVTAIEITPIEKPLPKIPPANKLQKLEVTNQEKIEKEDQVETEIVELNDPKLEAARAQLMQELIGELQDNMPKNSQKLRSKIPLQIVIPASIGIVILVLGNFLYFSSLGTDSSSKQISSQMDNISSIQEEASDADNDDLFKKIEAKKAAKSKSKVAKNATNNSTLDSKDKTNWLGKLVFNGNHVIAQAQTNQSKIDKLTIEIGTPAPAKLTPEQIVHNIKQVPWIKKIEIEAKDFEFDQNNQFKINSPAKVYIIDNQIKNRQIAQSQIKGHLDQEHKLLVMEIEVNQGYSENETERSNAITRLENNTYKYIYSAEVNLVVNNTESSKADAQNSISDQVNTDFNKNEEQE